MTAEELVILKDLIACLKAAGISEEENEAICQSLRGYPKEMDKLSLFIIQNRPTRDQIMDKNKELMQQIEMMNAKI